MCDLTISPPNPSCNFHFKEWYVYNFNKRITTFFQLVLLLKHSPAHYEMKIPYL